MKKVKTITREQALDLILSITPKESLVVACNGKLGRELFELRRKRGESDADFIMVGAMGCALPLALGLAINTKKQVICLLGDGNFLMKMGAFATWRNLAPSNLRVYILNNNSHDSTGGQPTAFNAIKKFLPWNVDFRVIEITRGAREDLGRPDLSPAQIAQNFYEKVR